MAASFDIGEDDSALSFLKKKPKEGADLISKASGMDIKPKDVKKGIEPASKAVFKIKEKSELGEPVTDDDLKDLAPKKEEPKEEPKESSGWDEDSKTKVFLALSAALPTLLGGAFGGAEGAALGAKTGSGIIGDYQKNEEEKIKEDKELKLKGLERLAKQQEALQDRAFQLNEKYQNDPTTKRTKEISDAYSRLNEVVKEPSAASDMALIYSFMKINDPGSTVREGEFATAQNAAGVPDRIKAQYNSILNGQRLSDAQRNDFIKQAQNLYTGQLKAQEKTDATYTGLGSKFGIGQDLFQPVGGSFSAQQLASGKGKSIQPGKIVAAINDHSLEDLEAERARRQQKAMVR